MADSPTSTTLSKRKVSHKGARAKGLQFEREIANDLYPVFPEAKRQLEYQTDENAGTDVANTDILQFQCKNKQNYVPVSTIDEVRLRSPNHIPVVITKGNRQPAMAILPWKDLLRFIMIAYGNEPRIRTFTPSDLEAAPLPEIPEYTDGPGIRALEMKTIEVPVIQSIVFDFPKVNVSTRSINDLI